MFSLGFSFQIKKYYHISKMGNNFHSTTPFPKISPFPKPSNEGMERHLRTPIWRKIKYSLILLSKNKTNRTMASYRRFYRSFHLLSPLVFTDTAFEISLFQAPERQYSSFKKIQFSKIFQELALHPQTPQLNYSLAALFRLRPLRFPKNSELFFKFLFRTLPIIKREYWWIWQCNRRNYSYFLITSIQFFTKESQAYLTSKTVALAPPILLFLDFNFSNLGPKFFLLVDHLVHFSLCFALHINERHYILHFWVKNWRYSYTNW